MVDNGDYFSAAVDAAPASLAQRPSGPPAPEAMPAGSRTGRRRLAFQLSGVLAVLVVCAALAIAVVSRNEPVADKRAILLPASLAGLPLKVGPDADQHRESVKGILEDIFGSRPSASAQYAIKGGLVNLLTGRGRIDRAEAGDVNLTSKDRFSFGEMTCSYMEYEKKVLTTVIVCWYSTPTFGASVLATSGATTDMAYLAASLEELIPQMRDGAAG